MKYVLLLIEKLSIYSAHYPWIGTFFSVVRTGTISSPLQILCSFVLKFSDDCSSSLGKQMHTLFNILLNAQGVSSVDLQSSFLQSYVLLYLFVHSFWLPPRHLWNYGLLSYYFWTFSAISSNVSADSFYSPSRIPNTYIRLLVIDEYDSDWWWFSLFFPPLLQFE